MREKIKTTGAGLRSDTLSKYFLLTMLLSFIGWAFETVYVYFLFGRYTDRGFMTMPFCPIYGCSMMAAYFLLGTPSEGRGILKDMHSPFIRGVLYFVFAFLIPSAAELIVGAFFDGLFGVRLWSYSGEPYNIRGYVCLRVSLIWAVLLFLFMRFLFLPLKKLVFKIPSRIATFAAALLLVAVVWDVTANFLKI